VSVRAERAGFPVRRHSPDGDSDRLGAPGTITGSIGVISAKPVVGQALDRAEVGHELVTYPGAPHSFFDRSFAEHADACDNAWRRVLSFLGS